jgi:23S rRNA pseudouridine1911/1915/1917 synthase
MILREKRIKFNFSILHSAFCIFKFIRVHLCYNVLMNEENLEQAEIIEFDEGDEDDYTLIETVAPVNEAEYPAHQQHSVTAEETGERVDKLVSAMRPDLSRGHVQRLIEEGNLNVNGKPAKSAYKLRLGDNLEWFVPPPEPLAHLIPENIPLDIIYQDEEILVINKPAGLVVHPAPGHASGTLVNALLYHVPELSINGNFRPGIVHHLDKDTSGLMVVAKTDHALNHLINQMKERTTLKEYLTLVEGDVQPPSGIIDAPIGRDPAARKQMAVVRNGKPARTIYTVLNQLSNHSYVQARLETGRTHQIRVHFSYLGHPVVSDLVYGRRKPTLPLKRQFLHAHKLGIRLPKDETWQEFVAPLPPDLDQALKQAEAIE